MEYIGKSIDVVIEIERELDLLNFKCCNIPVWWFTRDRFVGLVYNKITGLNILQSAAEYLTTKYKIKKVIDSIPYIFKTSVNESFDILALSTASARRHKENGKDFDVFFDILSFIDSVNYVILETPDHWYHSKNPYSKYVIYGDILSLVGNIGREFPFLYIKPNDYKRTKDLCKSIYSSLSKRGIIVEFEVLYSTILKSCAFVCATRDIVEKLLEKINPKIILSECGYSPSHMIIQYIAKTLNIPVIELQHGLIIPNHMGYFWGVNNRNQLKESPFPDILVVFGSHFKNILLKNPFLETLNIEVLGYPYLWLMKERYREIKKENNAENTILITSQPQYSDFWADMALEIVDNSNFNVLLKPHPSELDTLEERYRKAMQNPKIKVINTNFPLYEAFRYAEYHVSVGSTSVLEALSFGLKNIIVDKEGGGQYYKFLIDMGLPSVNTVKELLQLIKHYPEVDDIISYVNTEVFNMNENPISLMERFLKRYLRI